jgi:hypothetical protein
MDGYHYRAVRSNITDYWFFLALRDETRRVAKRRETEIKHKPDRQREEEEHDHFPRRKRRKTRKEDVAWKTAEDFPGKDHYCFPLGNFDLRFAIGYHDGV